MANDEDFKPPFPALTTAQRYHQVNGHVIVNVLSADEVGQLLCAMQPGQ